MTKTEALICIGQTIARFRAGNPNFVTGCNIADAVIDARRLVIVTDEEASEATDELLRRYGYDELRGAMKRILAVPQ